MNVIRQPISTSALTVTRFMENPCYPLKFFGLISTRGIIGLIQVTVFLRKKNPAFLIRNRGRLTGGEAEDQYNKTVGSLNLP